MRIAIIRLSGIGDCVLVSPVVEAIREKYPDASLTWITRDRCLPVISHLPGVSRIISYDDKQRGILACGKRKALFQALSNSFDIVINFQSQHPMAHRFVKNCRAKIKVTGETCPEQYRAFYTDLIPEKKGEHDLWRNWRLVGPLNIDFEFARQRYFPRVPITDEEYRFAESYLAGQANSSERRTVGFNLGATVADKMWPSENFARLASHLIVQEPDIRIIVFGGLDDENAWLNFMSEVQRQQQVLQMDVERHIIKAVGKINLMQLAAISTRCQAFVTADTGPMHIAAAVGAPVIALFGPTDRSRTVPVKNPSGADIHIIDAREVGDPQDASMEKITVEKVASVVCNTLRYPQGK